MMDQTQLPCHDHGRKWRDRQHTVTYPAWAEVKTDEIRCRVVVSRTLLLAVLAFLYTVGEP